MKRKIVLFNFTNLPFGPQVPLAFIHCGLMPGNKGSITFRWGYFWEALFKQLFGFLTGCPTGFHQYMFVRFPGAFMAQAT